MERKPALSAELVRQFVLSAHSDLEAIQKMLADEPGLVNATWDWGAGDFETALGAAAHTGGRDIALHLLANGARIDIYAAAMLGYRDLVKAFLDHDAGIINVPGAHGIPLRQHAVIAQQPDIIELIDSYSE